MLKVCNILELPGSLIGLFIQPKLEPTQSAADIAQLKSVLSIEIVQLAHLKKNLVPAGTVVAWATPTPPDGWVICDGSALDQATYPDLFRVLGSTYNNQKSPTTGTALASPESGKFRVPDYRGTFLRSVGGVPGVNTYLGDLQDDAIARNGLINKDSNISGTAAATNSPTLTNHTHDYQDAFMLPWQGGSGLTKGGNVPVDFSDRTGTTRAANIDHTHSVSGTAFAQKIEGDVETRPQNVGVYYIMKTGK